jgi:hypothetical protein
MNLGSSDFSFPPAPDPVLAVQHQIDEHNARMARIEQLKSEATNLRERLEALAFKLRMGMISGEEFDNHSGSIGERMEAVEAELKESES